MNGTIELTGTDFGSNCYRYVYDIPSHVMGPELPFQLGLTPVDNSSISPATGISKRLMGSTNIDSITETIVYEIWAKNLGNVKLDNFNLIENLATVFDVTDTINGTTHFNTSNVSAMIISGANPCNLVLNPLFDGITNTKIFNDNQVMSNLQNGYVGIRVSLRATNLISNKIYYSTTKSVGEIGNWGSRVTVIDSSNNGTSSAIDPNADGDAGDVNENIPTPYFFGVILPVRFIEVKAARINKNLHSIKWSIAPPPSPVDKFEVEYSENNSTWKTAGTVTAEAGKNNYYLNYNTISSNTISYRIKAYESTGKNYISTTVVVKKTEEGENIKITPNPADEIIHVYSSEDNFSDSRRIYMIDVSGKKVFDQPYTKKYMDINTSRFTNGYYVVNISDAGNTISSQVLIKHK